MSELKEHLFVPYSELQEGDELTDAITIAKSYYLKSEADKVIADLEESHKKEVERLLMEIAELKEQVHDYSQGLYVMQARAEKEARHHKYKRRLAMAKLCNEKWLVHNFAEFPTKLGFYDKWEKRWLELAEKFKPNNLTAQKGKGKQNA